MSKCDGPVRTDGDERGCGLKLVTVCISLLLHYGLCIIMVMKTGKWKRSVCIACLCTIMYFTACIILLHFVKVDQKEK